MVMLYLYANAIHIYTYIYVPNLAEVDISDIAAPEAAKETEVVEPNSAASGAL